MIVNTVARAVSFVTCMRARCHALPAPLWLRLLSARFNGGGRSGAAGGGLRSLGKAEAVLSVIAPMCNRPRDRAQPSRYYHLSETLFDMG